MSKPATRAVTFSPLLWLVPLPFVLAMCLPVDLSHQATPVAAAPVAADTESGDRAASAALTANLTVEPIGDR